ASPPPWISWLALTRTVPGTMASVSSVTSGARLTKPGRAGTRTNENASDANARASRARTIVVFRFGAIPLRPHFRGLRGSRLVVFCVSQCNSCETRLPRGQALRILWQALRKLWVRPAPHAAEHG